MSDFNPADDAARLERIFAVVEAELGPREAAWLAMRTSSQQQLRLVRMRLRDDMIRRAIHLGSPQQPTTAAKDLAEKIEHRLDAIRLFNEPEPGTAPAQVTLPARSRLDVLIDQIISLNEWRSIGWRQIHNIASSELCNLARNRCNGGIW